MKTCITFVILGVCTLIGVGIFLGTQKYDDRVSTEEKVKTYLDVHCSIISRTEEMSLGWFNTMPATTTYQCDDFATYKIIDKENK